MWLVQVHAEVQQDQSEFVTWLRGRGEDDACSALTVGMSTHGRSVCLLCLFWHPV